MRYLSWQGNWRGREGNPLFRLESIPISFFRVCDRCALSFLLTVVLIRSMWYERTCGTNPFL